MKPTKFETAVKKAGYRSEEQFFLRNARLTFRSMSRLLTGISEQSVSQHYAKFLQKLGVGKRRVV